LAEGVVPPLVLPLSIANGLVASCEADDFEFVSDWMRSSAPDTAPRANNIAQLRTDAACRGQCSRGKISKRRASAKSSMNSAPTAPGGAREHRQFMPVAAEISTHRKLAAPALPA
jgi:hypothetical protein